MGRLKAAWLIRRDFVRRKLYLSGGESRYRREEGSVELEANQGPAMNFPTQFPLRTPFPSLGLSLA